MTSDTSDVESVNVGEVRLAYWVDGPLAAPVLVLVNSLGLDLRMWEPSAPHFAVCLRARSRSRASVGDRALPTSSLSRRMS